MSDMCGVCLHVQAEHIKGECLPTKAGGVPCEPHRFVPLAVYSLEQLRIQHAELGRAIRDRELELTRGR